MEYWLMISKQGNGSITGRSFMLMQSFWFGSLCENRNFTTNTKKKWFKSRLFYFSFFTGTLWHKFMLQGCESKSNFIELHLSTIQFFLISFVFACCFFSSHILYTYSVGSRVFFCLDSLRAVVWCMHEKYVYSFKLPITNRSGIWR